MQISIVLSGNISDLVVDPVRSRAYAADQTNNRVYALGLDNGTVLATIPVRAGPRALAIRPSGDTLYVGHGSNRSIVVIDLDSLSVVRTFETSFFTWKLVAPDALSLVATTHDDRWWIRDYSYVLNSYTGGVIQRLCWSQQACNGFSPDTLVTMSPDGSYLFLADSLGSPTQLFSYGRSTASTWSFVSNGGPGVGVSSEARDLAISPDNQYVYLASSSTRLLKLWTTNFTLVRKFGSPLETSAVVVSAAGNRVATSGNAAINVFDDAGTPLWDIAMTARATRLRLTTNGDRFVAVVGQSTVQVFSSSPPAPLSLPLSGIAGTWLFLGAIIATTTEGLILAVLMIRQKRHAP
jgi:DNA-binding beta-propeller fold protein YncE